MEEERPKVIAVMGPTAVGKTALVLRLAKDFGAEIINADSVQVYRSLDIGTAKPTPAQRAEVNHHLLDIVDPDEDFNACRYSQMARPLLEELARQGKPALVTGGTGLYLKALFRGLFAGVPSDPSLRQRLRREADREGSTSLHRRLAQVDPASAQRLHPNDLFRIIRALEVWECSKRPLSELHQAHGFRESPFVSLKIGLHRPRAELYARINQRVETMMAQGFMAEVKELLRRSYGPDLKSMQSIGYRHLLQYLSGGISLAEALRTMKRDSRRYAKRQMTWFGRDPEIHWFHPDQQPGLADLCRQFLRRPQRRDLPTIRQRS